VPGVCAERHRPAAAQRAARDPRRTLGLHGEQIAAEHLQRLGYEVLARNVRTRHGEIDIVAREQAALVFVEVKTRCVRSSTSEAQPLAGVHPYQRLRLRRLASAWLAARRGAKSGDAVHFTTIRFDAIGVSVDRRMRLLRLDHIEAAW
jgi:putative endonuclease